MCKTQRLYHVGNTVTLFVLYFSWISVRTLTRILTGKRGEDININRRGQLYIHSAIVPTDEDYHRCWFDAPFVKKKRCSCVCITYVGAHTNIFSVSIFSITSGLQLYKLCIFLLFYIRHVMWFCHNDCYFTSNVCERLDVCIYEVLLSCVNKIP